MLTIDEARERVAKGAALLDRERPGWAQQIDTGTLRMETSCFCVLGQLEGSFIDAVWNRWGDDLQAGCRIAAGYGFHAGTVRASDDELLARYYRPLQDAWIAEIAARVVPAEVHAIA